MHPIDYAILGVYLAGVLALGLWLSRRVRGGADFFLGGRRLPWWAIGLSLVVSDIGAKDIVGLAQDSYRWGWVMGNWDWIGCIPAMVLAGLIFVPYFWAGGFYTIPEYFGRRYNEGVRLLSSLVWGLFIAGNIAGIFSASTAVVTGMLGLDADAGVQVLIFLAIAVGIYTYSGGLAAVVYTDVIQCLIMIAGMGLVLYYGLQHPAAGGWEALREKVTGTHPDHYTLFLPEGHPSSYSTFAIVFGLGIVLGPAYWIGNQVIIQRTLGAKSLDHARGGVLFGAAVKLVFPLLLVMPGLLAIAIIGPHLEGDETKEVFPRMVRDLLPAGARGLVFAAMVAGMMGNLDSYLNSASTLWTRDIIRKYIWKTGPEDLDAEASSRLDLRIGRGLTVAFLAAGAFFSQYVTHIFEFMQWMLAMFQGPSLALLLLGMFWKRGTAWGGFWGFSIGLAATLIMDFFKGRIFDYENPILHIAWWSFVIAVAVQVAVSLFTRPHSAERLEGLVYRRGYLARFGKG